MATYRISYYSKVARQWFTHMHLWREDAVAAQVAEHLACGYAVRVVREDESPF